MIPKPLPFIRIGLANIPLLLALDILPFGSFLLLLGIKVIGQGLISGTLFSYVFIFSLGGTGVSALLMYALRRGLGKERLSLIGTSAAGALVSNGVQLVLAWFFVFGESIWYMAVPILALGIVSGTILGICCEIFTGRSRWYASVGNKSGVLVDSPVPEPEATSPLVKKTIPDNILERFRLSRMAFCQSLFSSGELAVAGLCMIPALLLNPGTPARIVQFLFFFFLSWLSGRKNKLFFTLSVMAGIVFFYLLVPYGKVLFSLGPLSVTSGALWGGIRRAVTLEGLFMLSRFCIRRDLVFPGSFGEIIGGSFRIFSRLDDEKVFLNRTNLIERLDDLLLRSEREQSIQEINKAGEKNNQSDHINQINAVKQIPGPGSKIILAVAIMIAWLPLIAALF